MSARRALVSLIVCAPLALVVGCGSSSSSSSASSASSGSAAKTPANAPITVLSIGDTTGPTKVYGQVSLAALQGAAAYWNAHGGVDGHHVVVHHVSDNGDATTAVSALLQQLSSGSTPTLIDAGSEAGDVSALIPVIAKHNVFAFAKDDGSFQCATKVATTCPNEFTQQPGSDLDQQVPVASWLKSKGIKKVGILEEQIDYTEGETPYFIKALNQVGISHTVATFPATAIDLTPQMQQLKSSGAQAVFAEALGPAAGYALQARAKLDWNVPIVFDFAASGLDLTKLAPASQEKNADEVISSPMDPKDPSQGIALLLKYSKPYGPVASVPLDVGATQWDDLTILNNALKIDGNSLNVKALDAAMLHIPATDPLYVNYKKDGWSATNHDDVLASAKDWEVVPVGPVVNGQVHYP
jgi:ABC-type branched-subunit amino acid transport system substrate-binding protein